VEDSIVPIDLSRIFFGTDPALFYLEIVFRTCVVYAYALLLIRWVGGRGIAQMSAVEFLLVIALGSAVGDAMFYPEVPLFQAMLVITVVVVINKILDILIYRGMPPLEGLVCTIASRRGLISFICDTQAASLNLTTKFLFEQTRQPMGGQWRLSGKLRRSIATLDEGPVRAVHVDLTGRGAQGACRAIAGRLRAHQDVCCASLQ